jgi:transposase
MQHTSGSSVHRAARISHAGNRHLRRVLYMPAVVGVRFDLYLRTFYERLLERHKTKLQAIIASRPQDPACYLRHVSFTVSLRRFEAVPPA